MTGGVGSWLCRLLNSVGARVIGTVTTAEKVQKAIEVGAEFVVVVEDNDLVTGVVKITEGEGVAAVFEVWERKYLITVCRCWQEMV